MSGRERFLAVGAGAIILLAIPALLILEFFEPGRTGWDVFLILFLAAVVIAGILLQRFFLNHAGEIGEARFDTRNKSDMNG